MLSYQHEYHCGNHADVLKHIVLALCIRALQRKDTPLRVLDAHAGAGLYELSARETRRNAEYRDGVVRVLAAPEPPPALGPWLAAVRAQNLPGELTVYPGSPAVAAHLLRDVDHLDALELHPVALKRLREQLGRDRRVHVHGRDCHEGLPGLLPPPERRGIVLLDPSYEVKDEFRHTKQLVQTCHARFPAGVYLIWYPLIADAEALRFASSMAGTAIPRLWQAEMQVQGNDFDGMRGSGMLMVNPPYGVTDELRELLPWLTTTLAEPGRGRWRVDCLVPESG
jgi:23S rRNA (adenine2030-N6)-methyltransferase